MYQSNTINTLDTYLFGSAKFLVFLLKSSNLNMVLSGVEAGVLPHRLMLISTSDFGANKVIGLLSKVKNVT